MLLVEQVYSFTSLHPVPLFEHRKEKWQTRIESSQFLTQSFLIILKLLTVFQNPFPLKSADMVADGDTAVC